MKHKFSFEIFKQLFGFCVILFFFFVGCELKTNWNWIFFFIWCSKIEMEFNNNVCTFFYYFFNFNSMLFALFIFRIISSVGRCRWKWCRWCSSHGMWYECWKSNAIVANCKGDSCASIGQTLEKHLFDSFAIGKIKINFDDGHSGRGINIGGGGGDHDDIGGNNKTTKRTNHSHFKKQSTSSEYLLWGAYQRCRHRIKKAYHQELYTLFIIVLHRFVLAFVPLELLFS